MRVVRRDFRILTAFAVGTSVAFFHGCSQSRDVSATVLFTLAESQMTQEEARAIDEYISGHLQSTDAVAGAMRKRQVLADMNLTEVLLVAGSSGHYEATAPNFYIWPDAKTGGFRVAYRTSGWIFDFNKSGRVTQFLQNGG